MKTIKYIKGAAVIAFAFFFIACDQDESVDNGPRDNSTFAELREDTVTVTEGSEPNFTIVQEELVEEKVDYQEAYWYDYIGLVSGQIGVRVVGGTAIEGEDFDFDIPTIQNYSPFLLQDGYYYAYNASLGLEHTVSNLLTIYSDGIAEGEETIELELYPVGIGAVVLNDSITITITDSSSIPD